MAFSFMSKKPASAVKPTGRPRGADLIARRHPEWVEHHRAWRWLADSYEGGDRYKYADYSSDPMRLDVLGKSPVFGWDYATGEPDSLAYGRQTLRNLIPHLGEMDKDGMATYALRMARTPIPTTVERTVRRHLSRVYSDEVRRTAPDPVTEWWEDVDGSGVSVGQWFRKTVAPLLLVLGQLDLAFDHPAMSDDDYAEIVTRADQREAGLDKVVASIILPENLVWWRLEKQTRKYAECLVFERIEEDANWIHWTPTYYERFDARGNSINGQVEHPFGCVPIRRVFDNRKARCGNVGQSRYHSIADLQKAIYNGRSELILGDVLQSNPLLQGPAEYVQEQGKVSVGPDRILPKLANPNGSHEGWDFIDPPKGAAQEVRQHVVDWGDEADRDAALTKPAGSSGAGTVAQSGISKAFDNQEGSDYLAEVAETLAEAERVAACMALCVATDGAYSEADEDAISVEYPREFGLLGPNDLATALTDIQSIISAAGALPLTEAALLKRLVSTLLAGTESDQLDAIMDEIDSVVDGKSAGLAETEEARMKPPMGQEAGSGGGGVDPQTEPDMIDLTGGADIPQPDSLGPEFNGV